MIIETVKVAADTTDENPLGYVVINKSDLTEEHALFEEAGKKKTKAKGSEASTEGE
ncbi:hypothetical protein J1782_25185 [Rahnella sp. BCC 1045]|uniref:hypothetical protein n=1 Tax=Rahnella sp. BCC 1045 TaxID=2816251 RepID=UPI001C27F943|nr:hypothetical protein [Rahnella sp. BCC 1045]MBU9823189.1 hypothetical protein [Rahnella sp. BCC 1045]